MDNTDTLNQIAEHLEEAAALLRQLAGDGSPQEEPPLIIPAHLTTDEWVHLARQLHPALGERQEQVLREVANAHPHGIGTGPIWRKVGYEQTNTYLTLAALARHGLIRKDVTTKPHLYFLGNRLLDSVPRKQ